MTEFMLATDLIEKLSREVDVHGPQLRVELYISKETAAEASLDGLIGSPRLDEVEKTSPPRVDVTLDNTGVAVEC